MPNPLTKQGFRDFFEGLAQRSTAAGVARNVAKASKFGPPNIPEIGSDLLGKIGSGASRVIGKGGRLGLAGAALAALPVVGDAGLDLFDSAFETVTGRRPGQMAPQDLFKFQRELRAYAMADRMKADRYMRMNSENTALLARYFPHQFQEIMAGRELPQGAVVIGGEPRADLMAEFATHMSSGGFQQPSTSEEDFLHGTTGGGGRSRAGMGMVAADMGVDAALMGVASHL